MLIMVIHGKQVYQLLCVCVCFSAFSKFIYLFLAVLGVRCCVQALSSCGEWGPLFIVVHRLLIAVDSLVAEHRLQEHGPQQLWHVGSVVVAQGLSSCGSRALEHRLGSCGARAQLLCGVWDPPGPGLEPVSPALAGRFPTTVPPGKSQLVLILFEISAYFDYS